MKTGIVIVDHGSKRDESNAMLERVTKLFADKIEVDLINRTSKISMFEKKQKVKVTHNNNGFN